MIIAAVDIARILIQAGMGTPDVVKASLERWSNGLGGERFMADQFDRVA